MKSEDVFSPFGLLKKSFPQYSYREGQEEMAEKIETAFREKKGCLIEAGTGIGKSFAYLVPSLLLTQSNPDARVVIATSTITLQNQLFDKDIPFLTKMLGMENKSAILYGRSNYICRRRLSELMSSIGLLTADQSIPEVRLYRWCEKSASGSRIDLRDRALSEVAKSVQCDDKDCRGKKCPFFKECFFYSARRRAQGARIVVTNHHVVLVDATIRWENNEDFSSPTILPGYTHLVLDEAHHIETEATEMFSEKFSFALVAQELDFLTAKRGELNNKTLMEFLSPCDKSQNREFTKSFPGEAQRIRAVARVFMTKAKGIISRLSTQKSVLLGPEFYQSQRSVLRGDAETLADDLYRMAGNISSLLQSDNEAFQSWIETAGKSACSLFTLADTLRSFIRLDNFDSLISYAFQESDGDYTLILAPLQAGPLIRTRLLDKLSSYLFCSATLSVGGNFEFFRSRLGIKGDDSIIEGVYFSPFDYKRNLMYLIPQDGRLFVNGDADYIRYVASSTRDAILSSSGGALVLFTSIQMMKSVYALVKKDIGEKLELLVQDNTMSRNALLRRFRENRDSSLFAVSSFWEGVDLPGDTLRLLVIAKLPFDVPTDPVNKARSDYINRTSDKGSFISLTLPNAMIKMKQGVGRLIRSESDRGVVLILDGRIGKKFYSRLLFSSIPDGYLPEDTMLENIPGKIESFLF